MDDDTRPFVVVSADPGSLSGHLVRQHPITDVELPDDEYWTTRTDIDPKDWPW